MTTIKKKDFVELEYTGKLDDGTVFDTTDGELARKEQIGSPEGPITICIGEGYILKAIDAFLEGKETNKDYSLNLGPEEAFGKKNIKLLKMIPKSVFTKQKINPMPGLQVNIDGLYGIVKTAASGRIVVDFNHPLSGRDVSYQLKVLNIITKTEDKIKTVLKYELGVRDNEFEFKDGTLTLNTKQDIPEEATKKLQERLQELIPEIKKMELKKV